MGKIPGGILGKVQGKVGGIIGQTWKGISYIKGYTIPADPKTAAQLVQRSKMQLCVYIARLILTAVVQPFWDPTAVKRSGFNDFISHNIKLVDDNTDYESINITTGTLEQPNQSAGVSFTTYDSSNGNLTFNWTDEIFGNGNPADKMGLVLIDHANNVSYSSIGDATRNDEFKIIDIGLGHNLADMIAYYFCFDNSGESLLISTSINQAVTAA